MRGGVLTLGVRLLSPLVVVAVGGGTRKEERREEGDHDEDEDGDERKNLDEVIHPELLSSRVAASLPTAPTGNSCAWVFRLIVAYSACGETSRAILELLAHCDLRAHRIAGRQQRNHSGRFSQAQACVEQSLAGIARTR